MTDHVLEEARKRRGVSQLEAAKLLGVSQPMLSHMETGRRNVSADVARRAVELFDAEPTVLPLSVKERHTEQELATELASLGYPGFAHLKGLLRNPAEVLFDALDRSDLDVRVTEGLPWLVLHYENLDWSWLIQELKLHNRQNRLGFVVSLAERMAGSLVSMMFYTASNWFNMSLRRHALLTWTRCVKDRCRYRAGSTFGLFDPDWLLIGTWILA
jgi:transcriptional regulator with XRE-family HTH domain